MKQSDIDYAFFIAMISLMLAAMVPYLLVGVAAILVKSILFLKHFFGV